MPIVVHEFPTSSTALSHRPRINDGVRAVGPAVKRRSSSIVKHIATAATNAADIVVGDARGSNAGVAATAAGDNRRNRLLNVAMRSKAAAAAVEGSNYEDEVSLQTTCSAAVLSIASAAYRF